MESATTPHPRPWNSTRLRDRLRAVPLPRPELAVLLAFAALLYLWSLGKNGWANDYYSAAVRSMAGSWHDFLYGSFDAKGLMTVDKPPLALWVEALSVKAFGYNSLAILVPQALMGVASVGLLYDLVRHRWGRVAGTTAGLALALTPIAVAISRHNNPDALLVLCSVGALWCFVRALEHGATKWLVAAGVCVGLGFETKMGAALLIVPGMALAWLWVAPRGRLTAVRQLAWAGAALIAVALAWPVLVWLTPASSRPWISGTADNSIWSLIWEYNGFGRLEGQTGGPSSFGGGGGGPFGGDTGLFRLLNESLGGQAGWFLGAALVGGIGIPALSRLRRTDPRTGWIIAVGGAFATTAVAFSFAGGIFHPYYTSLLAPFSAALVGASVGQVRAGERRGGAGLTRILGAAALGAGAIVELVVIANSAGDLGWLTVPLVLVTIAAAAALLFADALAARIDLRGAKPARIRVAALAVGVGILLLGPGIWSVETLGHPTSGTFPAGGPKSASSMGGPGGGMGAPGGGGPDSGSAGSGGPTGGTGFGLGGVQEEGSEGAEAPGSQTQMPESVELPGTGRMPGTGELPGAGAMPGMGEIPGAGAMPESGELPGKGAMPQMGEFPGSGAMPEAGESLEGGTMPGGEPQESGATPSFPGAEAQAGEAAEGFGGASGSGGPPSLSGGTGTPGGMFGGEDLTAVVEYTEAHGGGTIAVDSQSGAAASIIEAGAEVAGIGGFSGKESSVSAEWLEERIEDGDVSWIYTSGLGESGFGGTGGGPGGGDTRTGSESAIETVLAQCTAIDSSAYGSASGSETEALGESTTSSTVGATLYKCEGS